MNYSMCVCVCVRVCVHVCVCIIHIFFHCAFQLISIKLQLGYFDKVKNKKINTTN